MDRIALEEALRHITIELIAAHKAGNQRVLYSYANQAKLSDAEFEKHPGKLFMKLIQIYHPDRLESFAARIAEHMQSGNVEALAVLESELVIQGRQKKSVSEKNAHSGFSKEPENYIFRPSDFGFAHDRWNEYDVRAEVRNEPGSSRKRAISILEALRRIYFGNLELQLTRADLEELDGDLELYDMGIGDLEGIQLCRRIEGLNLSLNHISDINPLRFLRHLETLDLSNNEIEDADSLGFLTRLQELDLAENYIEDIAFLEKLPRLRVVNLSGNPLSSQERTRAVLEDLRARGVLVLSE